MAPPASGLCFHCNQPCTLRCAQCSSVFFCSRECQQAVWPDHESFCEKIAQPIQCDDPTALTVLVVDGLGPLEYFSEYTENLVFQLNRSSLNAIVLDATKGRNIPKQIASLLQSRCRPHTIIMLGWGSDRIPVANELGTSPDFQSALVQFVQHGGSLVVQGERMCGAWPRWFGKDAWATRQTSYYRTDHECIPVKQPNHPSAWYTTIPNAHTGNYNVKAFMLGGLDANDILYGEVDHDGCAAVALATYGRGTISFFGDVNWEDSTLKLMTDLAKYRPPLS